VTETAHSFEGSIAAGQHKGRGYLTYSLLVAKRRDDGRSADNPAELFQSSAG